MEPSVDSGDMFHVHGNSRPSGANGPSVDSRDMFLVHTFPDDQFVE